MVSNEVDTVGTALLLAAAPAGRGRAMDAASVLPALAAVPPSALTGTPAATVVELADPLDPQTVLTRLRAAAAAPGPLAVYLAGQLHLDRRQQLPHLALARTTAATLRYTGLPWHWLAGELALRAPGTTTVVADLVADAELWQRLTAAPGLLSLGPGPLLYGRVLPAPRRGAPATPEYLRAFATIWRTGARPSLATLHEEAVAGTAEPDALLLAPPGRPAPGAPGAAGVPVGTGPVAGATAYGPGDGGAGESGRPGAAVVGATVSGAAVIGVPTAGVAVAGKPLPGATVTGAVPVVGPGALGETATTRIRRTVPRAAAAASETPAAARATAQAAPPPRASAPRPAPVPVSASGPASAPGPVPVPVPAPAPPPVPPAPPVPAPTPAPAAVATPAPQPVAPAQGGYDPHPAILGAAQAGRHGEAVALAVAWEQEALRRHGARSQEAVHWMEVRADLARLAGEPARSSELWISAAQARLGLSQGPGDPDVEGAVDRAHHQWEQIQDTSRARELAPALVELRERVPGRRAGALEAIRRRLL
ncbi:hypothetical protein ACIGBL_30740 [Streptomyces sp. NPDC085614]|uniref:hypothetical protein n=1 Tax=Streptomyces sp. NPDC085614 TaxID=3365733 RepID=UPI0037D7CEED